MPNITQRTALALLLGFLCFYTALASAHYVGGDHALFTYVGVSGSYAHAPGYPIFSFLCRFFAGFGANPYLATSIGTGLLGAVSIAVLYRGLRAWGLDQLSSVTAATAFGLLPHVVFLHTQAEVFALNHLFVSVILWASAPSAWSNSPKGVGVLGLFAGLALSHHHTAIFLAPLGLWVAVQRIKASSSGVRAALSGVLGLCLGLVPYLYLPWVASHTTAFHWGDPSTFNGLVDLFLRRDFGTFTMTVAKDEALSGPLAQWMFLASSTLTEFVGLGVGLAVWGAFAGLRTQRAFTACVLAGAMLSGPVFVSLFHRAPIGLDTLLVQKFHVLFFWHLAILGGLGLHHWRLAKGRALVAAIWCVALGITATLHTVALQDDAPAAYVEDLWAPLPQNAVLIASGDHATAGSWAYNTSRGSSAYTVAAQLLAHGWYRRQVNAALGIETTDRGEDVDLAELIRAVQATGRPVFMTSILNPSLARVFPSYPLGLTIAMLPPGERPPAIMEVAGQNAAVFEKFKYQGPSGHTGPWADVVRESYRGTWLTLAGAFEQMGNPEAAKNARLLSDKYGVGNE